MRTLCYVIAAAAMIAVAAGTSKPDAPAVEADVPVQTASVSTSQ